MLVRFAYLAVTNTFAALRLLPMSGREKDAEILALRHQIRISQRHLGGQRVRFEPADRALLAALLGTLPGKTLRLLQLVMSPDNGSVAARCRAAACWWWFGRMVRTRPAFAVAQRSRSGQPAHSVKAALRCR
ncbi:hypothetical protein ABIA35_003097 [Catenulispora sp. MAP12-49]|uniref:hypothetical protein n=1 Tax=unclassified Catenulispora TaxID=414885 RepID=UPI0035116001